MSTTDLIKKENITEGCELTSEVIIITNNVQKETILECVDLQIDGTTSKGSSLYAKKAKINNHQGDLRCSYANINILDGGTTNATEVDINTAISGTIYA